MMNFTSAVALLGVVFASGTLAQAKSLPDQWAKYEGCYQTVSLNGNAVTAPSDPSIYTSIYEGPAIAAVDPATQKTIPSLTFFLFQSNAATQGNYNFYQADAFLDRGEYTNDANGSHFNFDGTVDTGMTPSISEAYDSTIDVQVQTDGMLQVHVSLVIDQKSVTDDTYELQKMDCPSSGK